LGLTLEQVLLRIVAAALVAPTLGGIQGRVAARLGDRGPAHAGRTSLSPFAHLGGFGFLAFLLLGAGWVRSVDVDPAETRAPRRAALLTPLAGLAATVALALVALVLRGPALQWIGGQAAFTVVGILNTVAQAALVSAAINLVPLPPLAAGTVWRGWWPSLASRLARIEPWLAGGLFALLLAASLNGAWGALRRGLLAALGL
jgi:hypothetical protein